MFEGLSVTPVSIMIILVQFFDFLYLLFCFAFINMIEAEYVFFLTHYIIGLDYL